jgi:hypothetical protein
VNGFLNQDCVLVQDFESIFPGALFKIVFQQYRSLADIVTIPSDVRFTPDNGNQTVLPRRRLPARL